jgi:hypothetical protein
MKIHTINTKRKDQGTVLLISLGLTMIIGIFVTSYLAFTSFENKMVARSQSWNTAMPTAEAGVEEALTQLYRAGGGSNLSTNAWAFRGDGMYHKKRTLTTSSYYNVAIQPLGPSASLIWSTGYVAAPLSSPAVYVRRLVRVLATNAVSFGKGITAKGPITFNGGAHLSAYTVSNGVYNTTVAATAAALSNSGASGAVTFNGGGYVAGNIYTGPGGSVTIKGSAAVGDSSWIASASGIQSGHFATDANYQFQDNSVPALGSYDSAFVSAGTTNIAGIPGLATTYLVTDINLSSSSSPLLIYGDVTIYATGSDSVTIKGNGYIKLMPGASLNLYVAGNVDIGGGGVINGNNLAGALHIYGLPTSTKFKYTGGADFIGVVDAPEADFTFSGGARAIGAFVANSFSVSGGSNVYWDSSLGGGAAFAVASWNEMALP